MEITKTRDCPPESGIIVKRKGEKGRIYEVSAGAFKDDLSVHLERIDSKTVWLSIQSRGFRQAIWLTSRSSVNIKGEMD